jgi:hypothetical protein
MLRAGSRAGAYAYAMYKIQEGTRGARNELIAE